MNTQSYTPIPSQAVDMLRSPQNLVVTARHGSALQRRVLEELVTSTWNIGNDLLVVCSDAVFVQVTAVLRELVARTGKPAECQFCIQPAFEMLSDLDHGEPSLVLVTANHLFGECFAAFNPSVSHTFGNPAGYWPYAGTVLSIGLDTCADIHEAAHFEVCWRAQQRYDVDSDIREIVLVEGAANLTDLAASSKAQVVQIESPQRQWRFQTALFDREVCIPILKAYIASADYIAALGCVEFLEDSVFPILPDGFSANHIASIGGASLEYLRMTGQIWPLKSENVLYYTVFPYLRLS